MADLIVLTFPTEERAMEVRTELGKLSKEYLIDLDDVVVVTRDSEGKIKLHQAMDTTKAGAISGAFWGLLIGFIFSIPFFGIGALLLPLLGVALGAGAGALGGAMTDLGIDDDFIKQVSQKLQPGGSALFMLVAKMADDKVLPDLAQYGGEVLQTSLSNEAETKLRAALDTAHDSTATRTAEGTTPAAS